VTRAATLFLFTNIAHTPPFFTISMTLHHDSVATDGESSFSNSIVDQSLNNSQLTLSQSQDSVLGASQQKRARAVASMGANEGGSFPPAPPTALKGKAKKYGRA